MDRLAPEPGKQNPEPLERETLVDNGTSNPLSEIRCLKAIVGCGCQTGVEGHPHVGSSGMALARGRCSMVERVPLAGMMKGGPTRCAGGLVRITSRAAIGDRSISAGEWVVESSTTPHEPPHSPLLSHGGMIVV